MIRPIFWVGADDCVKDYFIKNIRLQLISQEYTLILVCSGKQMPSIARKYYPDAEIIEIEENSRPRKGCAVLEYLKGRFDYDVLIRCCPDAIFMDVCGLLKRVAEDIPSGPAIMGNIVKVNGNISHVRGACNAVTREAVEAVHMEPGQGEGFDKPFFRSLQKCNAKIVDKPLFEINNSYRGTLPVWHPLQDFSISRKEDMAKRLHTFSAMMRKFVKLCISAVVFGDYDQYIPAYIYSILRAYPEYFVKIFYTSGVSETCTDLLKRLPSEMTSHYQILPLPINFGELSEQGKKSLRWYLPEEVFKGYDCAYIGDVDFIIIKEEPSILEGHIQHCGHVKLPFSNIVRKNYRKMSGLHFFKVKEYYHRVNHIISKKVTLEEVEHNEHQLYNILREAFGDISKLLDRMAYRPHHGIHLGITRTRSLPENLKDSCAIIQKDPFYSEVLLKYGGPKLGASLSAVLGGVT